MIEAKSDRFWDLVPRDAAVTKVVSGFQFTEGPVFSRRGYLLFSDLRAGRIHKWERGKLSTLREQSNGANGLTFDHQGRLLACEQDRVTRTEKNGSITVLAGQDLGKPNDLVYSIDGSVYFSDLPKSRVYRIGRNGKAEVVAGDCVAPNGVALSSNQQLLYVADAKSRKVRVYRVAGDGSLEAGRDFAETRCDGLKTDEGGNVWVAGSGGIWVFSAQGEHLGTIGTPEQPSNCAWGAGFRGLYITAQTSVYLAPSRVGGTRTF
ncbi:MAG: SMP-30/gluconolactonase/LRE family protein [Bryobacteraceae bacterium]